MKRHDRPERGGDDAGPDSEGGRPPGGPEFVGPGEERPAAVSGQLFTTLYDTLRAQARAAMRGQPRSHTLQPTALVNEVFIKLANQGAEWHSRAHFLSVAARAMRAILVDHARNKTRQKRKAAGRRVELDGLLVAFEERSLRLLELDAALGRLAELDDRAARIVELRFFGGLAGPDIAEVMGVPLRTVERDWMYARAWLHAELS